MMWAMRYFVIQPPSFRNLVTQPNATISWLPWVDIFLLFDKVMTSYELLWYKDRLRSSQTEMRVSLGFSV